MNLIGKKIKLREEVHTFSGKPTTVYHLDDPEVEQEIRNEIGGEVRIFPPGWGGTSDYKQFRTTIYVDQDGIVTDVKQG